MQTSLWLDNSLLRSFPSISSSGPQPSTRSLEMMLRCKDRQPARPTMQSRHLLGQTLLLEKILFTVACRVLFLLPKNARLLELYATRLSMLACAKSSDGLPSVLHRRYVFVQQPSWTVARVFGEPIDLPMYWQPAVLQISGSNDHSSERHGPMGQ